MSKALVSERLLLTPFAESDISPRYIGWLNDPDVVRFSNQRFRRHDRQSSEAYLRSFAGSRNRFWSIRLAADQSMIGTMTAYVAPQHGTADLGLLIGERHVWGRGYGLEAWSLLVNFMLQEERLRKIAAGTVSSNTGMVTIMRRSGMHHEATRKQHEVVDGELQDIVYFAKFKHD
jgi:ribosomal-protein-alanine N-acetyltransferase